MTKDIHNSFMLPLCVLFIAALSGCATTKQVQGPNGTPAYFVKCGSSSVDRCYEEAAKACPNGYTILDRHASKNAAIMPAGNAAVVTSGPNSMLVECK